MPLITVTSPHSTSKADTGRIMRHVIYATLPALVVMTWAFGLGNLLNVLWCIFLAVALEALCLKLRGKPIPFFLKDYSAAVTGLLLGLSISPFAPWWISVIGMIFAIPIAKHLYGGLGSNPFNPAMIGYALLLVSFPVEMTRWAGMHITATPEQTWLMFSGQTEVIDQITGATPLDTFKIAALKGIENNRFWLDDFGLNNFQLKSWMAINIAFLIGGIYLLYRKIITWHIPVSVIATLTLLSSVFFYWDNTHYASPLLHLLSGATMIGAFFIATDPVSAATSLKGRLIYGAGIGALLYIIRTWGGYPDAIAFAVLFMNLSAPMIDHLVQPRTFGHDIQPVKWRKEQK